MALATAPLFYSTNGQAPQVDLKSALLAGQAPDRGLYLPEQFIQLAPDQIAAMAGQPYHEIAFQVIWPYAQGVIEADALRAICANAYNYDVPLEPVRNYDGQAHILRLDRGPTASFKDFAARLMARLIGRFITEEGRTLTILVATSGDTGSAVASAFHGVPGIRVLVLFPENEVSLRQRKQMTTLGGNVRAIALRGKFDDCQALVKRAFADAELDQLALSSANSINIGRLLPQTVYYFYAASRTWGGAPRPVVFSIPSGNFGNMMGAVIASRMGLPVRKLIVPVNENDEFPVYLETGEYHKIEPSRACLSNAMNVGHPSNLARLVAVYGGHMDETGKIHRAPDHAAMHRDLFSVPITDEITRVTIREAWERHQLLLEPHGAVGWRGFQYWIATDSLGDTPAIVVETAHPAKFPEAIQAALGFEPEAPETLLRLESLPEDYPTLDAEYGGFKQFLMKHYA